MGKTTISVERDTRKKLKLFQLENNLTSLDTTIKHLLEQYENK